MKKLLFKNILFLCLITNNLFSQTFIKNLTNIHELVEVNNQIFFVSANKNELWKTDGTKGGTFLIKKINSFGNSNISNLTSFNNELFFSANDGFFGQELWKTDGTTNGTKMLKNIHESFGQSSSPNNFTILDNELYFTATDKYIGGNYQIWKTNGNESETIKVFDGEGHTITNLIIFNNKLYFKKGGALTELNISTNNTTHIVVDSEYPVISELNSFNDGLYFIASNNYSRQKMKFYKLDNNNNLIVLKNFTQPQYGDIDIHNFTQVGHNVFFSITTGFNSGNNTDALWKTDGTNTGTFEIKSFGWNKYSSGSNISNFIEYKNQLYFNSGAQNNYTLWKSDGTKTGTKEAVNVKTSSVIRFFEANNLLHFSNGNNLWTTDGTIENTKKFSDLIIPQRTSDDHFNLKKTNSTIYFEAKEQQSNILYSTELNSRIHIKKDYSTLKTNDLISFNTKIDSIVKNTISIKNIGKKDLVFSAIKVVGQDFYIKGKHASNTNNINLDGSFPKILTPNAQANFEISFYPGTKGVKNGTLSILSNDIGSPSFKLELNGYSDNKIGQNLNSNISLNKEIKFNSVKSKINISNNLIEENQPINSLIGILNIPNSNDSFEYELDSFGGNTDHENFSLDNNKLKTNQVFNFEQKNTYILKIKATNKNTNQIIEENITVTINDTSENIASEKCSIEAKSLGYGLNDVEFLDNQSVIAVGTHGVILKSNDSGNTWRNIRHEINNHLNNVHFTSNSVGYAIGNKILKTIDAGETWFTIKLPDESYPTPTNLFFLNSEKGFVFGNNGKIFKTSDGGKYWKSIKYGNGNFNSAFFFNESKGYIVGNSKTLIKTINGGENWENIEIDNLHYGTNFTNISFINNSIGFISGNKGEIIKTVDAGTTWTQISKLKYDISIKDLIFKNENIGYALTENYLYKTTDGGLTWNEENLEYFYSSLQAISNNTDKNIIVGHGTSCCSGFNTGHIIHTKKLNNEWVNKSYLSLRSTPLNTISMKDNIGVVFGNKYGAKTTDNGVTWKNITLPEEYIYKTKIYNNIIYSLGQNNLHKSTDQGETWTTINTPDRFKQLFLINDQIIYALSNSNAGVFKTVDGGSNWTKVNQSHSGLSIHFKNENEGFIGTIGQGMIKTIDGGNTWTQVSLKPIDAILNIYAIDFYNDTGFAASTAGLLKTIDGGENWVRMNKNIGGTPKFVKAVNDLEWFIATDNRVLKTYDKGLNWKSVYYGDDIKDVHLLNKKLFIAGYRNLTELSIKNSPTAPGYILGHNVVVSGSKEEYSLTKSKDIYYKWTVSGDNQILYKDNKAEVSWNSLGEHTVKVTPFNDCKSGAPITFKVIVKQKKQDPNITGDIEVNEFSVNKEYTTSLNSGSRYTWFVNGHNKYYKSTNKINIDWDKQGNGKIEVIETEVISGLRTKGHLDIKINPSSLSLDEYELRNKIYAFPNPTNGIININIPIPQKKVRITIYSINSQIVSTNIYSIIDDNIKINFNKLSPGLYFVKIHLETPKLIKIIKK